MARTSQLWVLFQVPFSWWLWERFPRFPLKLIGKAGESVCFYVSTHLHVHDRRPHALVSFVSTHEYEVTSTSPPSPDANLSVRSPTTTCSTIRHINANAGPPSGNPLVARDMRGFRRESWTLNSTLPVHHATECTVIITDATNSTSVCATAGLLLSREPQKAAATFSDTLRNQGFAQSASTGEQHYKFICRSLS